MPVICDSDASIEQAGGVLGNGLCGGGTLFNFIADQNGVPPVPKHYKVRASHNRKRAKRRKKK